MSAEDPGLLGNLPRSRPGRRSDKRVGEAPARATRSEATAPAEDPDPVGDAVRAAVGAAGAGLRIADGVAREVIRRLPRR
jgi:hypothetical protein